MNGCAARHSRRLVATSGRSRSLALRLFFEREAQPVDRVPERGAAHHDTMRRGQPVPQAGQRDVRLLRDARCQRRLLRRRQLARPVAPVRARRTVARHPTPDQCLVDVGHAHIERACHPPNRRATVHRRQHPVPEILRLSLTPSPHHPAPNILRAEAANHTSPRSGIPYPIPLNARML